MPHVTSLSLYAEDIALVDELRKYDLARVSRVAVVRRAVINELARLKAAEAKAKEQAE